MCVYNLSQLNAELYTNCQWPAYYLSQYDKLVTKMKWASISFYILYALGRPVMNKLAGSSGKVVFH